MTHLPRKAIALTTFGTLAISDGADASRRSRRALALLALAAAGGPNGTERAGAIALLWPDSDTERAANSFRQILHGIRRDLGDGAIVYESGYLKLNPAVFSVDLWDFEHALRADDFERVAALYTGPFLGSFHISGLLELERWVEAQRERLRQVALATFRRLATTASAATEHQDAIRWWRAAAEVDPLSSKNALGLLRALANAGDRIGALNCARTYEALVRAELETDPDQQVGDYVALLRRSSGEGSAVVPQSGSPGSESQPTTLHSVPSAGASRSASGEGMAPTPNDALDGGSAETQSLYIEQQRHEAAITMRGRVTWRVLASPSALRYAAAVLGAIVLLAGAAIAGRRLGAVSASTTDTSNVVAVLPFHMYSPADSNLGVGLAALLSADLDGAGGLHSIPTTSVTSALRATLAPGKAPLDVEAARRVALRAGAGLVVIGEVVGRAHGLRLWLALHDARQGDLIGSRIVVDTDTAHVLEVVDVVTGQLLAQRYGRPAEHLTRAALLTTRSLVALKAYLSGETALRDGRYVDAVDEFEHATSADSLFALGYYRLAVAADGAGRAVLSRRASELAIRYSDHLDDRDRRLILAYAAFHDGHASVAEETYRSILEDYPDNAEAWFQLGEALFHNNPLRGESAAEARPAFERLLALDPDNLEAVIHLGRIASLQGRQADAEALERRALKLADAAHTLEQRAFRVFALADRPGIRRVSRDLERAAPPKFGSATLLDVAIAADDVFGAEKFARAVAGESVSPGSRAFGLRLLAHTSLAQGKWSEARAQLDSAMVLDRELAISQLSLAATLPFVPAGRSDLERIYSMVRDWQPVRDSTSSDECIREGMNVLIRLHRLGMLSVRLDDLDAAKMAAASLESVSSPVRARRFAFTLAQSIRARISAKEGHLTEALAMLEAADWEAPAGLFAAEAADRFFRATLLEALGRTREASGWYGSIAERAAYELPYLAPAQLRLAGIARVNGDLKAAEAYDARAAELWRNADTAVRVAFR